jgi:predicted house-cleaning noncanonical NTP pyrophosphatase (MazG superfamily)
METNFSQADKKDISKVSNYQNSIGQKLSHEAVFMTLSKKTEKISTALYMVTDLIDVADPIRQRIRECGVDLIAETRSMSSAFSGDIYFSIARVINKSWEIVSLVEVASSVGFISDMNSRILKSVLVELISSLRDKQKRESFTQIEDLKIGESLADQITLSKSLFDVKESKEEKVFKGQITPQQAPKIKDKEVSFKPRASAPVQAPKFELPKEMIERTPIEEENKVEENGGEVYSHRQFSEFVDKPKASERRSKIIDIVKEKGEVVVNDITASFPGISSKTIQRELTSLVEENVLKRVGEKRWSKYSLA